MTAKLLTEHHLEFLSLKEAAKARLSLHLSKYHIFGNHMSRLKLFLLVADAYTDPENSVGVVVCSLLIFSHQSICQRAEGFNCSSRGVCSRVSMLTYSNWGTDPCLPSPSGSAIGGNNIENSHAFIKWARHFT